MKPQATILIIPGLRDHVAEHWQTLLENQLKSMRKVISVPPLEFEKLSCAARVDAIERCMQAIPEPVIVVAHSAGVAMFVHWAQKHSHPIVGALLAAPADLDVPLPAGYPTIDVLQVNGWLPLPRSRLPFSSLVVSSVNDPLAAADRVQQMASDWGGVLVNAGAVGHLNPASGFGAWPEAMVLIQQIEGVTGSP